MKVLVNPKYEKLRSFIESLPSRFDSGGELIHNGRNKIRVFDVAWPDAGSSLKLNVKRYRIPILLNRIVYGTLRKPKGVRAFANAQQLLALGIDTPEPVAYVEERRRGLLAFSYFVCLQSPYANRMYHFKDEDADAARDFISAFARYIAGVHEAGVLHKDLSPGNILYEKTDGGYRFTMVDINRMEFRAVGVREGCRNFGRLWGTGRFFRILAEEYAAARGANPEDCYRWVLEGREEAMKKFKNLREMGR